MCVQNLKFVALPVSDIIAIGVLGLVANPNINLGEEQAVYKGVGDGIQQ